MQLGFHASHEQHPPSELLAAVRLAEQHGFDAAMCSDHFAPWSHRQGHSGFAWSWLGAALQATSLPFGVVTAPGQRYHPAVAAQAIATLAELFPGRFWAALGSGEAVNEHITGDPWPAKEVRDERLLVVVDVIRALLRGEEVTRHGLVEVDRARLWSRPAQPPQLYGAAVSAEKAETVGDWADGLITVNQPPDVLQEVIAAFRAGGGEGKPVAVQVHVAWNEDEDRALAMAHDQWTFSVLGSDLTWDLELPAHFDEATRGVEPEQLRSTVLVSSDLGWHRERLLELASLGFDAAYLHPVADQLRCIEVFAEHVRPALATATSST